MADRTIIPVLGMHRSGTSAITRGLKVLSVELGDNLMPPVQGNNDKGFWEDLDIYRFNEALLRKLGSDWDRMAPIDASALMGSAFSNERYDACRLIDTKLNGHDAFAFKDPRTAILMPFWRCIFDDLTLDDRYLIAVRNPLEVARSLNSRDAFSISKGLTLWAKHALASVQHTAEKPRVFVSYDAVLKAPLEQLERIAKGLDLVRPDPKGAAAKDYSNDFLDLELRQHLIPAAELLRSDDLIPIIVDLYQMMSEWVGAASDATIENPEKELAQFNAYLNGARPLLVHADRIELDWRKAEHDRSELASAKTKLEERVTVLDRERADLLETQKRTEDRLADLEAKLAESTSKNEAQATYLVALQSRLDETVEQRDNVKTELSDLQAKYAQDTNDLAAEIRALEAERDEARDATELVRRDLTDELEALRARHVLDLNAAKAEADRLAEQQVLQAEAHKAEIARLREGHEAERQKAEQKAAKLKGERAELQDELRTLDKTRRSEVDTLKVQVADYRKDLLLTKAESRALRSSTSWKLTRPLRAMGHLLNRRRAGHSPAQITKTD